MPRVRDPLWEYVESTAQKKNKCKFCQLEISGGISRLKYHWAKMIGHDVSPCTVVTDEVIELALNAITEIEDRPRVNKKARGSNSKEGNTSSSFNFGSQQSVYRASGQSSTVSYQPKVLELLKKKEKEVADAMGVKFLVANNLAFNILRSHKLREWCLAIGKYGEGYVPPGSETARTKILGSLKDEATMYVKSVQESWEDTGCTLMSDGWTDARRRHHVNLLASSPSGIVFLKSEVVKEKQTGEYLANFIMSTMEEIGSHNMVQVVTDKASNYGSAGAIIQSRYPHVFKTSCATHCIDLILEDIDKLPSQAHKRTKEDDAKALVEVIQSNAFWIKGNEVVAIVEPIVKLLRMVDGDECTLGYIYEGVIRVKESIKVILNNDKDKYDPYLAIIERKRIQRLHSPIHAVAAYLNPKFYYEKIVKMDNEIRDGMSKVRQKLLTSEERKTFTGEITFYHARHSKIFTPMAVDALSNTHPRT
ncbi:hypothetical protein IFM89_006876 [Coptis chinensis]|uniref:BED-type domain-containing protein n=1 Tax=Coptis chinensis TaxID=261450 RepID=A0A835GY22_9MAGN|nr:hypothetical protein IFM89_006876 [Coptis chinensis]